MINKLVVLLAGFLFVHCGAPDTVGTEDVAAAAQPVNTIPAALELTATGASFLYTATNTGSSNAIAAYRRDPGTGAIGSLIGIYSTGGAGSGELACGRDGEASQTRGTGRAALIEDQQLVAAQDQAHRKSPPGVHRADARQGAGGRDR